METSRFEYSLGRLMYEVAMNLPQAAFLSELDGIPKHSGPVIPQVLVADLHFVT